MFDKIRFEIQKDNLTKEEWTFYQLDKVFYLDGYRLLVRPTPRHQYVATKRYNRIDTRQNTIQAVDVPLTDEIKHRVYGEAISLIQNSPIKLWDR